MSLVWGVYEERTEDGEFVAFHVMPCVVIEGEDVRSGDHEMSADCPCNPVVEVGEYGQDVVQHHAPDHPGALTEAEWKEKTREAQA